MARKLSQLDSAATPSGGERLLGTQGGESVAFALGTHVASLDASGKVPASQIPPLAGAGDMSKSVYDPANKNAQVLAASDLSTNADWAQDTAKLSVRSVITAYVTARVNALLAQLLESTGAAAIGIDNDAGARFSGADTLAEFLDWVSTEVLLKGEATDPVALSSLVSGDKILVLLGDGGFGHIDPGVLSAGTGNVSYVESSTYTIQATDLGGTVIMTANNPTVTIPLFGALNWPLNRGVRIVHGGSGTLTVNCANASILLNEAANGVITTTTMLAHINLLAVGGGSVGRWLSDAPAVASVTDTSPPVPTSVSPLDGATSVDVNGNIVITYSEPIAVGGSGTRTFTLRKWNGSAFADEEVWDLATEIGTGAGQASISGSVLTLRPTSPMTAGTQYARRNTAGAVEDLAGNDCAAVADDTTHNWTTAAASIMVPTVVAAAPSDVSDNSMRIASQINAGGATTWSKALPTLQTGDMLIWFDTCASSLSGMKVTTSGYSDVYDVSTATTPAGYIVQKVMGGTPDTTIGGGRNFDRNQAAGYIVVRGPNLTISGSNGYAPTTTGSPDAPAYAQVYADELRVIAMMLDSDDLDLGVTAIAAAGWDIRIKTNAAGSAGQGSTLVVATKAAAGAPGDSVDPPASTGGTNRHRSIHFGIRSA